MKEWRREDDYAIAFGSAHGIGDRQLASMLGPDVNKNMVIGRRHRLGLELVGSPRPTKEKRKSEGARSAPNVWSEEEIAVLRENWNLTAEALAKLLPKRTPTAIQGHRHKLGLFRRKRFTSQEDSIIRERYAAYVDVHDIANELGRDFGTVRQRCLYLGLRRDGRKTALASRFGLDVLNISNDPFVIRQTLLAQQEEKKQKAAAEEQARINAALATMRLSILNGGDRAFEMRMALLAGATLQQIGDEFGITRERVRQIVHIVRPKYIPKPSRTIECKECHAPFQHQGRGTPKYCDVCRPVIYQRHLDYVREYGRAYRQTKKGREYKRDWMRKDRLKKKMLALDGPDLARVLHEVATLVERKRD